MIYTPPQIEQQELAEPQDPTPLHWVAVWCFILSACAAGGVAYLLGLRDNVAIGGIALATGFIFLSFVVRRYRVLSHDSKLRVNQILQKFRLVYLYAMYVGFFFAMIHYWLTR